MKKQLSKWALGVLCAIGALSASAEEISVAVAANFSAPLAAIAQGFERATGHKVQISSASTGKLYAQIAHGAPFAVLLAADRATPERIAAEGLGDAASRFTYARGRLVLWSARPDLVDGAGQVLATGGWTHIAIASPKLAPYGAAAMQTLDKLGLTAHVQPRTVWGENIGQTYQFAASGAADLGFVALSQIWRDGKLSTGSAWLVPEGWYTPIDQDAIVLKPGAGREAVAEFMRWLRGDKARAVMERFGYTVPQSGRP